MTLWIFIACKGIAGGLRCTRTQIVADKAIPHAIVPLMQCTKWALRYVVMYQCLLMYDMQICNVPF